MPENYCFARHGGFPQARTAMELVLIPFVQNYVLSRVAVLMIRL